MTKETCELCGYRGEPGTITKYRIVPIRVTEEAGLAESATVRLCSNCHREVGYWYSRSVCDITYDPKTQQFRQKSSRELVKEYEASYRVFAEYKRGQMKIKSRK